MERFPGRYLNEIKISRGNWTSWTPGEIPMDSPIDLRDFYDKLIDIIENQLKTITKVVPIGFWNTTTSTKTVPHELTLNEEMLGVCSITYSLIKDSGLVSVNNSDLNISIDDTNIYLDYSGPTTDFTSTSTNRGYVTITILKDKLPFAGINPQLVMSDTIIVNKYSNEPKEYVVSGTIVNQTGVVDLNSLSLNFASPNLTASEFLINPDLTFSCKNL